ncbi:L-rhamnose mutarotase [Aliiglaciecola sp. 3_MG-2023]|uniref:L-rhamnose mutarotase n=1 Tax=Aliiglaciecola sp. 3_MG-2023 TaxID=3062644 RepID=UPI0026E3FF01|nr:L-rhamnose mutarotase [Aliiglaciecola sp. 3_MG-2023]MDO6693311.1 L-rhamnose mutarotase [Aliiglaciecola sp. 3_MG-2023]
MEKIAFVMTLLPGFEAEYEKRHDEIWPELVTALKEAGVSDYSIFFEKNSNKLFAVLKRTSNHEMDQLPLNPIVKKWWAYMADIMLTNPDNSPQVNDIPMVFHLD